MFFINVCFIIEIHILRSMSCFIINFFPIPDVPSASDTDQRSLLYHIPDHQTHRRLRNVQRCFDLFPGDAFLSLQKPQNSLLLPAFGRIFIFILLRYISGNKIPVRQRDLKSVVRHFDRWLAFAVLITFMDLHYAGAISLDQREPIKEVYQGVDFAARKHPA